MSVKNIYTSIGCNDKAECADWGNNGLIVFGACNSLAILDPRFKAYSSKITHTFVRHTGRVNTVRWLKSFGQDKEIYCLSGSEDKLAILWNIENLNDVKSFELKGHEDSVSAVDGLQRANGEWLLATGAYDCTIKLWSFIPNKKRPICKQTVRLNTVCCFTLRLVLLHKYEKVLLAFSTDEDSYYPDVALWAEDDKQQSDGFKFIPVHKIRGHEESVIALDFVREGEDIMLATSANDYFIRLWRITARNEDQVRTNKTLGKRYVGEQIIQLSENSWYSISAESVLYGHDSCVRSVNWNKTCDSGLSLLSASNETLIIWRRCEKSGRWMEKVRLNDIAEDTFCFYGGKFSSDGKSVLGHSRQSGLLIWKQSEDNECTWISQLIVSGNFREVRDLAWEPTGAYVMSMSADGTTRVHADWACGLGTWVEVARPQVHSYDMFSRYKFACSEKENIVRIFQASDNFVGNFRRLAIIKDDKEALSKGPENLMCTTLWPEVQRLYGHGYEISALASSPDGSLLASSCKSENVVHGQIALWDTDTWHIIQLLCSHQLTVTQMRFSPGGQYLLSVSRERRWSLFKRQHFFNKNTLPSFALTACTDEINCIHTLIIWSCDWSYDSKYFVTSSAEGKVVVWCKTREFGALCYKMSSLNGWKALDVLELKNISITAVSFAHSMHTNGSYILALGCESGLIHVYRFNSKFTLLLSLNKSQSHHLAVKHLQFRPCRPTEENQFQLASCGEDGLLRIYQLSL